MKKVTDLKPSEAIHCPTKEEWNKIIALNPNNTLRSWEWDRYTPETVYNPNWMDGHGGYGTVEYHETNGYTIYPASDFLEPEFAWGEEVEVRLKDSDRWYKRIFVGKNPRKENWLAVDSSGATGVWHFIRKIPKEEPAQEMTMEQIEKELGKKIKIVK